MAQAVADYIGAEFLKIGAADLRESQSSYANYVFLDLQYN